MPIQKTKAGSPLEFHGGMKRAELMSQYRDTGSQLAPLTQTVPFIPCRVFSGVQFRQGTPTMIAHGLGRPANGYLVVNVRYDHTISPPTAAPGWIRNDSQTQAGLNENTFLSLGPFGGANTGFLADVMVW